MIMVMIILNVMAAVDFALRWSIQRLVYIKYGQTIVDEYLAYLNFSCSEILIEITGIVSSICADSAMVL